MFTYWIKRALVATSVMTESEREGARACDGWVGVGRDAMEGGGKGWREDERYEEVKKKQNISS
jgi:hypothetical protein